jgi:hypothetical protein
MQEDYFEWARSGAKESYKLWSAKQRYNALMDSYDHPDQAISDPKFYVVKDALEIAVAAGRYN